MVRDWWKVVSYMNRGMYRTGEMMECNAINNLLVTSRKMDSINEDLFDQDVLMEEEDEVAELRTAVEVAGWATGAVTNATARTFIVYSRLSDVTGRLKMVSVFMNIHRVAYSIIIVCGKLGHFDISAGQSFSSAAVARSGWLVVTKKHCDDSSVSLQVNAHLAH